MKRAILIIAGIFIAAGLSLYILDINLFEKNAPEDENPAAQIAAYANEAESMAPTDAKSPVLITLQENTIQTTPHVYAAQISEPPLPTSLIINGRWELMWRDTFDAPSVDLEAWTEIERRDSYNGELQYYSPLNSYIQDGCLYLTAKRQDKDGKEYTSGMVQTLYKRSLLYGRIEARIKLPEGKGLFPAFWLLSENYEIDIMEMIGSEPDIIYGVNHSFVNGRTQKTFGMVTGVDWDEFHVYAMEWEPDELRWYIDDKQFYQTTKNVSDEEMYIIFTMAVGGVWPGRPNEDTAFPRSMIIDEISVYRATD